MRAIQRRSLLVIAVLAYLGCAGEGAQAVTQIVVAVSAEPKVSALLARLEVRLLNADATIGADPQRIQQFALKTPDGRLPAARATLPFSFGIVRGKADVIRLELRGFASFSPDAALVIERSEFVRFKHGQTLMLPVLLGEACLGKAERCSGEATCAPERREGSPPGGCFAVTNATTWPIVPGSEIFADTTAGTDASTSAHDPRAMNGPDAPDAGSPDAATSLDSSWPPAGGESDDAANSNADSPAIPSVEELPPELLAECPTAGVCPLPEYPCVPSDDGQGYTCRGQYAAWPMPDAAPGAKFAPAYAVMAEQGLVLDEVTGLLWQREPPLVYPGCSGNTLRTRGDACTWAEADHYCSQLQLAGKRWRLPSKIELESLLDLTRPHGEATLAPEAFPTEYASRQFWSSTRDKTAGCSSCMFSVDFDLGLPRGPRETVALAVRCVRNERTPNAPAARYRADSTAATVYDKYTQLEWQVGASASALTQADARAFCSDLGPDFRVPSYKELLTLMDVTHIAPGAFDPLFEPLQPDWLLWSSTPAPLGGSFLYSWSIGYAMAVDLSGASRLVLGNNEYEVHVRCVR